MNYENSKPNLDLISNVQYFMLRNVFVVNNY